MHAARRAQEVESGAVVQQAIGVYQQTLMERAWIAEPANERINHSQGSWSVGHASHFDSGDDFLRIVGCEALAA
jgi:uncharacterized protein affecting Mg2+/Co2+ transport